MSSKYDKNYASRGYTMKYEKPLLQAYFKNQVFQFKIELQDTSPAIWRRIQVPSDYNFWDLHTAIQDAMGWQDSHLHQFEFKGKGKQSAVRIGIPDFDGSGDLPEVFPGWEIPILTYFKELGGEAKYIYDYGDDWMHTVKLEGYIYKEKGVSYPICIGGERACPPEDCGGIPGYQNVIDVLSDPTNDDYEQMRRWADEHWNPELFYKDLVLFDDPYKRWKVAFIEK